MNDEKILSVKDLSKVYKTDGGDVRALDNISFDLYKSELLAIMGTSGSGKSTLLNVLGAMDEPTSGEIKLNGKVEEDMFKEPKATVYRRENVGFVFQSFNLLKDLSVEENISMPLLLRGDGAEKIKIQVDKMLGVTGLTNWRKHRPVELSGGQQQRVAIGRALITSPPIVLADEPTGNLDFNTSTDILKTILQMKEQYNQSIIIVTHDPSVASYADRVLFFHDGKIVSEFVCNKDDKDIDMILSDFRLILSGETI
ncbi:ABC transporter ATP-binding protein [Virgibacillus chiguensis]|uniref:Putative ABC transport system ATP-binding protein n=1 Tax=Virgibacillus chiguensis TaxID=411959 RepID=A0A1M5T9Z6_9BACI|nr:ABC transporter ATP-binding protein [Virgibacillus chiguensis]SHH47534.1 putative ABC transport system ATP-binding protein [Virgibacillus chiguensis]